MNKHSVFPYDLPPASSTTGGAETASRPVNRKTGIVASIVLAVLGLLTFFTPISMGVGMAYLLTAGLMVYGISQTVAFFRAPKEARSGWSLVNGIMLLLFSGFTLWSGLSGVYGTLQMIASLSYVAGFLTIAAGISQISTFFALQRASGSGWIMASGILNLLLSLVILANPVASWFTLTSVWGIYLTVSGIALFAESLSGRRACHS
ncbi:MAG TPA: DUF308 domain-containing protein [Candidatus Limiplasma pullistercoris]|nr:DUF308 domain-containing protein [Candidatus Limiplasma pullistercoris]